MKVKLFTIGKRYQPAINLEDLETAINTWLEEHPDLAVDHVHRLSQPTLGWGQLSVAVWYTEPPTSAPTD
jgi:hypothetical protein